MLEEFLLLDEFIHRPRIAYFSMEIALRSDIPTYSGGLGILAGDVLRSSADLELPLVAVTLASRSGYFRQEIDAEGNQIEHLDPWNPADHCTPLKAAVAIPIEGRDVWIIAWLHVISSEIGGRIPVVLLDTDIHENHPDDRKLTHHLYGGDQAYRLKQEMVLGIGGMRMLQALGFEVMQYHMNEGHAALLALGLLRRFTHPEEELRRGETRYDILRVRGLCNFTTHTPVEAGHDKFPYELVRRILGNLVDLKTLKALGGEQTMNMTLLALNLSDYVNGVAKRHAEVSERLFPGYRLKAVTNGVHPFTWTSDGFARLFDSELQGWAFEPQLLMRADSLNDEAVWDAHREAKQRLIENVANWGGIRLDPELPILGFARRMTAYKRPELLFSDMSRLRAIAHRYPFQIVISGKAHPHDAPGKEHIRSIHARMRELAGEIPAAYVANYDMDKAKTIIGGVDVWLNTPLPPLEASGTSGMKAAFNGVPQLGVMDGWWIEGCIEGVTGWSIGYPGEPPETHGGALYDKLEKDVLSTFHEDRAAWIRIMKATIAKNASTFNSHRMMRRYVAEAYIS